MKSSHHPALLSNPLKTGISLCISLPPFPPQNHLVTFSPSILKSQSCFEIAKSMQSVFLAAQCGVILQYHLLCARRKVMSASMELELLVIPFKLTPKPIPVSHPILLFHPTVCLLIVSLPPIVISVQSHLFLL